MTRQVGTSTTIAAPPPPVSRALDLRAGTLFGFRPGPNTNPDLVLNALTPVLGPPTRDTGWYVTRSVPVPGGGEDCLGHNRQRILRWGSVSYAFWHSNVYVLWSWTLGNSEAAQEGDRREPHPIIERPIVKATTVGGLGVGTPVAALRNRLGDDLHLYDNGQRATASAVQLSIKHGAVTGYAGVLSFC